MFVLATATTFATATAADSSSTMVGTNSASLPPAYLSVPNVKDCLGSQSVGTSTIACIPKTMPAACDATSWGQLQADNAGLKGLKACATATATTQLPTGADIKQYKAKVQQYMQAHSDEIRKFVAEHKEAIDGVEADIEKAIESGKFDIENYQTEIKKIVDAHGLEQYRFKFDAFVALHQAELEAFVASHKGEIDTVLDKIQAAIKSGNFDFQNYQQQIETFVKKYGLEQYDQKLKAFVASHKAELEAFTAAHKEELDTVKDKIQAAIKSGNFDFQNYQQQIQKYQAGDPKKPVDEKSGDKDADAKKPVDEKSGDKDTDAKKPVDEKTADKDMDAKKPVDEKSAYKDTDAKKPVTTPAPVTATPATPVTATPVTATPATPVTATPEKNEDKDEDKDEDKKAAADEEEETKKAAIHRLLRGIRA